MLVDVLSTLWTGILVNAVSKLLVSRLPTVPGVNGGGTSRRNKAWEDRRWRRRDEDGGGGMNVITLAQPMFVQA
jgi:hypothetical protein